MNNQTNGGQMELTAIFFEKLYILDRGLRYNRNWL
jgi:hypothetical protein